MRSCQGNQTMPPCFTGALNLTGDAICSTAATPPPPPKEFIHPTTVPFSGPALLLLPPHRRTGRILAAAAASRDVPRFRSFGVVLEVVALKLDKLVESEAAEGLSLA
ncbi:hypothetical protein LX36DRAFT_57595 [Colletotrichum falcatum]|nr:hypothetical protein LX36DRAFT_57595 [Colletotrichum falcatum]